MPDPDAPSGDLAPPMEMKMDKTSDPQDVDKAVDFAPPEESVVVLVTDAADDPGYDFPHVALRQGVMGEARIQLMQVLGMDVNHPFDAEVEEALRSRFPDFDGQVSEEQWIALVETDPLA